MTITACGAHLLPIHPVIGPADGSTHQLCLSHKPSSNSACQVPHVTVHQYDGYNLRAFEDLSITEPGVCACGADMHAMASCDSTVFIRLPIHWTDWAVCCCMALHTYYRVTMSYGGPCIQLINIRCAALQCKLSCLGCWPPSHLHARAVPPHLHGRVLALGHWHWGIGAVTFFTHRVGGNVERHRDRVQWRVVYRREQGPMR